MLTVTSVQYLLEAIVAWRYYDLFTTWVFQNHFDPIRGVASCIVGPISYLLLANLVGIYDIHLQYLIMIMCTISYSILFLSEALAVFEGENSNLKILRIYVKLINILAGFLSTVAWSVVIFYLMANCDVLPNFVLIAVVGVSLIGPLFALNYYNWFSAKRYDFAKATYYNTLISVTMNSFIAWILYLGFG
jgi:hypothetical protein